jgi:hypothetical protein
MCKQNVNDGTDKMAIPFIGAVLDIIKGPLDKLIPDKNKRQEFEHAVTMSVYNSDLSQMEVNKVEAAHHSIFVAGWRPFVGWTCGMSLALDFLVRPIVQWGILVYGEVVTLPTLDTAQLMPILMGMLGLGTLRTYEKFKGVARKD